MFYKYCFLLFSSNELTMLKKRVSFLGEMLFKHTVEFNIIDTIAELSLICKYIQELSLKQ